MALTAAYSTAQPQASPRHSPVVRAEVAAIPSTLAASARSPQALSSAFLLVVRVEALSFRADRCLHSHRWFGLCWFCLGDVDHDRRQAQKVE